MQIEISDQTMQRIADVLGSSDPSTINLIMKRVSEDEQLLMSLSAAEPNEGDLEAVREGLADVAAGRTQRFSEFMSELREEMGLEPRVQN